MTKMKSIFIWLPEFFKWLLDYGKYYILSMLIILITLCYFTGVFSFQTKIVSSVFLIAGLILIIKQMIMDAKRFSEFESRTLKNVIKKFPKFKFESIIIKTGTADYVFIGEKVRVEISIPESASIEEKVNFLMRRKVEMGNAINNLDDKLDDNISEVNKKIKEVKNLIEDTNKLINSNLAIHIVGSYDLSFLSVVLMICGSLMQILI